MHPQCRENEPYQEQSTDSGSTDDKKRTGRKKSAADPAKMEQVRETVELEPYRSSRRCALDVGDSRTSTFRILKSLELKVYHPTLVQELKPTDYHNRTNCNLKLIPFFSKIKN